MSYSESLKYYSLSRREALKVGIGLFTVGTPLAGGAIVYSRKINGDLNELQTKIENETNRPTRDEKKSAESEIALFKENIDELGNAGRLESLEGSIDLSEAQRVYDVLDREHAFTTIFSGQNDSLKKRFSIGKAVGTSGAISAAFGMVFLSKAFLLNNYIQGMKRRGIERGELWK